MTAALAHQNDPSDADENAPHHSKRPVHTVRVGAVSVAIWGNPTENGIMYATTVECGYRDKDGNWQSSQSFGPNELLQLSKASDLAHTKVLELMTQRGRGR